MKILENLENGIHVSKLYVTLGNYEPNKKVRFFARLITKTGFELFEITNDGLKIVDEKEVIKNNGTIYKVVSKKYTGSPFIPFHGIYEKNMEVSAFDYSKPLKLNDKYKSMIDNPTFKLTDNLLYNTSKSLEKNMHKYLVNLGEESYISIKDLNECKSVLDKICEESHSKYLSENKEL